MTTQTARITILSTPDFKSWLAREAEKEGVSLSELIRRRCRATPGEDEAALSALVGEVREASERAKASLAKGLKDAEDTLTELRRAGQ